MITIMNIFNIIVKHTITIYKYPPPCRQICPLHFCSIKKSSQKPFFQYWTSSPPVRLLDLLDQKHCILLVQNIKHDSVQKHVLYYMCV